MSSYYPQLKYSAFGVLIIALWFISAYNRFINHKNMIEEAWGWILSTQLRFWNIQLPGAEGMHYLLAIQGGMNKVDFPSSRGENRGE